VQLDPGPEAKPSNSEKYDVNRIGQRNTGKGVNLYSLEKERALGQEMAQTIDRQTKFVTDPNIVEYVSGVAQRIIRNSDAQVAFTIKVVDSTELNTFALPGGFLYVDKGLLSELDSESELAGLIAHEVAHVAARHGTRYATRRTAWNLISFPVIYVSGPGAIGARQIGPLALRKFARDAELEADLLGMEYQYAAGYDPLGFIEALERLHNKQISAGKHEGPFGRSLHQIAKSYAFYPPMQERIVRLQSEISSVLPCRDTYVTDTSEFQEIRGQLLADQVVLHRDHADHGEVGENGGPVLRRHPTEWLEPMSIHTAFLSNAKPFSF
jgi:Zn-dependent protease with chaperone function